jgi:acetyl esterase/lipase
MKKMMLVLAATAIVLALTGNVLAWYKDFKAFEAEPKELFKWAANPTWLKWVLDTTIVVVDGEKRSESRYASDVEPLTDGTFAMAIVQTFTDAGLQMYKPSSAIQRNIIQINPKTRQYRMYSVEDLDKNWKSLRVVFYIHGRAWITPEEGSIYERWVNVGCKLFRGEQVE